MRCTDSRYKEAGGRVSMGWKGRVGNGARGWGGGGGGERGRGQVLVEGNVLQDRAGSRGITDNDRQQTSLVASHPSHLLRCFRSQGRS